MWKCENKKQRCPKGQSIKTIYTINKTHNSTRWQHYINRQKVQLTTRKKEQNKQKKKPNKTPTISHCIHSLQKLTGYMKYTQMMVLTLLQPYPTTVIALHFFLITATAAALWNPLYRTPQLHRTSSYFWRAIVLSGKKNTIKFAITWPALTQTQCLILFNEVTLPNRQKHWSQVHFMHRIACCNVHFI